MTDKIQFFGSVDCDRDGRVTSETPAWMLERHMEYLEDEINKKKAGLARGAYESDQVPRIKGEIEQEQKRLQDIINSKPNLTGANKDKCFRAYQRLAERIKESMPTRKDSKNGLVNPYQELKRMKEKHIPIDAEMAKACNVTRKDGKISGDEAAKCYAILGKALGEDTNIERLRRDGGQEAFHRTIDGLTEAILKRFEGK